MATLEGSTIASTYDRLLALPSGGLNGATLVALTDGDASATCALSVATTSIAISATDKLYFDDGSDTYIHEAAADRLDFVVGGDTNGFVLLEGSGTTKVGIGTAAPDSALELAVANDDQIKVTSAGTVETVVRSSASTGTIGTETNHNLYLRTNNSARMTILAAGNVGIGTATPDTLLEISADSTDAILTISTYDDSATDNSHLILRTADGTEASPALVDDDDVLGSILFQGWDGDDAWISGASIIARCNGTPADGVMPCDLEFATNTGSTDVGSAAMIILESGNVGVGTNAPGVRSLLTTGCAILDIAGTPGGATHSPALILRSLDTSITTNDVIGSIRAVGDDVYSTEEGLGAEIRFASSGVWNATTFDYPARIEFFTNDGATGSSSAFAERMVIGANGDVGIRVAAPSFPLHVQQVAGTDEYVAKFEHPAVDADEDKCLGIIVDFSAADPDDKTQIFIKCEDEDATRFVVYSDGDILADATSIDSDERLKENIVDATSKLDDINKLKVRSFNFREKDAVTGQTIRSKVSSSRKRIGFIAQEFEEVFPSLVREAEYSKAKEAVEAKDAVLDDEGNIIEDAIEAVAGREALIRKALSWDALVPMLVKSIQELSAKVTALENA